MRSITRCILAITVAAFTLASCSEDEVPKIGFTSATSDVVEGSTVSVPLSVAIPSGVTPIITFTGTATENTDFTWAVSADGRELVFETFADNVFDDETIAIEITGFNGSANVGATVTHTINIQDPGLKAELTWTRVDGGTADLDLVLFRETSAGSGQYTEIGGSFGTGTSETYVLRGDNTNAKYAFGIEYFGGTSDDIDFTLTLSTTAGTVNTNAKTISFSGTLTQFNLDADVANVTFTKNNFTYSGFSNLFVPVAPPEIPVNITLSWNAGAGTAGDVDMDLYLFYFNPGTGLYQEIDASLSGSSPTETVTLPGDAPNGTYGLRYKYYSGTSNTLSFTATFVVGAGGSFTGTANNTVAFNGSYTLSNVNSGGSSNISQTFVKNGTTFGNFTTITTPVSGSRAQFEEGYTDDKNRTVTPKKSKAARTSIKKEKGLKGVTLNLNK